MFDKLNVDVGIQSGESGKDRSKQHTGTDGRQTKAQQSALQPTQFAKFAQHVVFFGQHIERTAINDLACAGRPGRGDFTVKQDQPEFIFELAHRLADCGLSGIDGASRSRKAALLHHFHECLKAA